MQLSETLSLLADGVEQGRITVIRDTDGEFRCYVASHVSADHPAAVSARQLRYEAEKEEVVRWN